jgi:hypothetical protein
MLITLALYGQAMLAMENMTRAEKLAKIKADAEKRKATAAQAVASSSSSTAPRLSDIPPFTPPPVFNPEAGSPPSYEYEGSSSTSSLTQPAAASSSTSETPTPEDQTLTPAANYTKPLSRAEKLAQNKAEAERRKAATQGSSSSNTMTSTSSSSTTTTESKAPSFAFNESEVKAEIKKRFNDAKQDSYYKSEVKTEQVFILALMVEGVFEREENILIRKLYYQALLNEYLQIQPLKRRSAIGLNEVMLRIAKGAGEEEKWKSLPR